MKSEIYPFCPQKRDYPKEGSIILKDTIGDNVARIEFDKGYLLKVLNNEMPLHYPVDFPKLTDKQLNDFLYEVTQSIVEVHFYKKPTTTL